MPRGSKGPIIRCFVTAALATLIYIHAHPAYAANPAGITVIPHPAFGGDYSSADYSGDWRQYCAPGAANTVRWYSANGTLYGQTVNPIDCSNNQFQTQGLFPLWSFPSSVIPASLPHNLGGNTGPDGDFYL